MMEAVGLVIALVAPELLWKGVGSMGVRHVSHLTGQIGREGIHVRDRTIVLSHVVIVHRGSQRSVDWEVTLLDDSSSELTANYGCWSPHMFLGLDLDFIDVDEIARSYGVFH